MSIAANVNEKLDKLRKDLLKNVDEKIQAQRDEISLDLGVETP